MQQPRNRLSLAVLATVLFVAISLESTPSVPAPTSPYQYPPRDEKAVTQDLTRFLADGAGLADGGFHAFRSSDLPIISLPELPKASTPKAAPPEPRRLSLLDPGTDLEAERRFLRRLPYGTAIAMAAERHRVDPLFLAAIVSVESGFSRDAVSPQGAMGLMQVIPDLAADYGVTGDLLDPYVNADVGSRYVRSLLKDYHGDVERALAAYNAGPGVVDRYKGVPPYRETRQFVREVLARYDKYSKKVRPKTLI
jgi:soluble lytic murein transglycosylase-like protein